MREVTTAPTPGDTIVKSLIHVRMDDGSSIRTEVKVDTMLDHLGVKDAPAELKRLLRIAVNHQLKRASRFARNHG